VDSLKNVKNLNLWGQGLSDISVLQQMVNVEVVSMSVNDINSLKDFEHCFKLSELYLRKNNIGDLTEVAYLKDLPSLKVLWLCGNPCADVDDYRLKVLSVLDRLEKLDDQDVSPDERKQARDFAKGKRDIVSPSSPTPDVGPNEEPEEEPVREPVREPIREEPPIRKTPSPRNLKRDDAPLPRKSSGNDLRVEERRSPVPQHSPREAFERNTPTSYEANDNVFDRKPPVFPQQSQAPQQQYSARENQNNAQNQHFDVRYQQQQPPPPTGYLNLPEVHQLDSRQQQAPQQQYGYQQQQQYQQEQPRNKWRDNQAEMKQNYFDEEPPNRRPDNRRYSAGNNFPQQQPFQQQSYQNQYSNPGTPQKQVNRNNIFTAVLSLIQELDPERLHMVRIEIDKLLHQ
jgi:hypothetical protein